MSKQRTKLMTATDHASVTEALTAWVPDEELDADIADVLQSIADGLEARNQSSPTELTSAQRRFLGLHFVQNYAKYDGLAWVAENGPASIPDAAEACSALKLTGTKLVLDELMDLFGGAEKMRDEEAMKAAWEGDDGALAEKIEPLEERFFDLETAEPLVKAQLELIAKNPKDFIDA